MGWTAYKSDGSQKVSERSGLLELIYAYTVTGSDKTTIDTGVDTKDAGSGDWTNGDVLEIFVMGRTDETAVGSFIALTLNNDTANNYRGVAVYGSSSSGTVSRSDYTARANVPILSLGASGAANYCAYNRLVIPAFTSTTFYKIIESMDFQQDSTSANQVDMQAFQYLSTSALTRVAITPLTAAKKLKVGTQLLIYKRKRTAT